MLSAPECLEIQCLAVVLKDKMLFLLEGLKQMPLFIRLLYRYLKCFDCANVKRNDESSFDVHSDSFHCYQGHSPCHFHSTKLTGMQCVENTIVMGANHEAVLVYVREIISKFLFFTVSSID